MGCMEARPLMNSQIRFAKRNFSVELSNSFRHWAPRPDAGGPLVGDSRWWLLDFSTMTGEEENSLKCHNKLSTVLRQAAVCCRAFKVRVGVVDAGHQE